MFASRSASAQQNAVEEADAQQLFDEGRSLMNTGDYARACPKFEASRRSDPAAGTVLNLANCYEKNGQVASAWVTFKDAAIAAHQSGRKEWEARARQKIKELEPQLSYLVVHVPPAVASTPGLVVSRDGSALQAEMLGTRLPMDPGIHHLEAHAPGKAAFTADVVVDKKSGTHDVTVASLADLPPAPVAEMSLSIAPPVHPAEAAASESASAGKGQRTAGVVMGAVGLSGLAVGAVTGILTIVKNHKASACPSDGPCSDPATVDASNSARTLGNASTVSFIAGGALLASGVLVYLLAPRESHASRAAAAKGESVRLAPVFTSTSAGAGVSGRF